MGIIRSADSQPIRGRINANSAKFLTTGGIKTINSIATPMILHHDGGVLQRLISEISKIHPDFASEGMQA